MIQLDRHDATRLSKARGIVQACHKNASLIAGQQTCIGACQ